MIILRNISLRRGGKVLLSDANLTIQPGQRLALIGANGCGKSTLFAFLLGELGADSGHIEGLDTLRIAAMAQEVVASEQGALEYLISGNQPVFALREELHTAELAGDFARVGQLHNELEALDGYAIERQAQLMLLGLGFTAEDSPRSLRQFSGGWRIRLNLGRALMSPSDVLLLDEPTNHLDLDATLWLQQWLQAYPGTLILVSHDREFIDATCQQIIHMERHSVMVYKGNYSAFESQRAERLANQQATYAKQQRRIAEIDDFVRRFRYKATKAKQAQSRLKELERMQKIAPAHVDSPFHFNFPEPERASDPLLRLDDADLGYGSEPVLRGVDLQLRPGSRIGLLGRNGAGKSTLLKSLTGELPLLAGERMLGPHSKIGYFDQHQLEALDLDASAALHLQRLRPDAREQEILNFIGGFNFSGDTATAAIRAFSGGEKARLALALTVWQRPNLLILDEPTNHLDMDMRLALTMALQTYSGAVVLVTHDRHLLRNTVDELLLLHDGRVDEYTQDVSSYEKWILKQNPDAAPAQKAEQSSSRKQQRRDAAHQREQLKPLRQAITLAEKGLARAETKLSALEEQLADAELYTVGRKEELADLVWEQGRLQAEADQLEEHWLELHEELEALERELAEF
ncbi:MAG: ATP-binding cassette domain-containing protein [Gammaproteobacteria bacterium]|nr:ATP-binding cassette domain-containing protein [Gammaproteobacteria bacterium]